MPKICPVCGGTFDDVSVFCPSDGASLRADAREATLVGSVIAERYLVTDRLGEGGMGTVYLARHVRLPQQVAIKVLRPEMLQDPSAVSRFNREAANASRIEHERVARVFDFGETHAGQVYLAMEYIQGVELKALLDNGPLPLERTVGIIRQVADGLDAAHKLGIVHRDLKPDNIMVVTDDGRDRCKVLDFGIAKGISGTEDGPGLTRTGFVVGTPEFMSPEQLLGEAVDGRSDVYSLALVAYQCLTGDLPFDTHTPDRGMTARLVADPRPLAAVRSDVAWPASLQPVFNQALHREVAERPATAGAFARALEEAIKANGSGVSTGVPPLSPPSESAAPAGTSVRTNRLGLAVAAVVLVAGIAGWVVLRGPSGAGVDGEALAADGPPPPGAAPPTSGASGNPPPAPATASGSASNPSAAPRPRVPTPVDAPSTALPVASPAGAGTASTAPALAARTTLDSITRRLDPEQPDAATARAAVPALRALLPRLGSARDSTWALIRVAEAHLMLEQEAPACAALRDARRTAASADQSRAITNYVGLLGCQP